VRRSLGPLLAAMRPSHAWKSVPVLAPLVFGHRAGDPASVGRAALAAAAFTLAASAGYLVNDVVDAPADRLDPRRARRPIASGALAPLDALLAAALLAAIALGAAYALLPLRVGGGLAIYLALSLSYTCLWKRFPPLGPLVVAGGFVLRVLVGSWAVPVVPSPWLVALTGVLALALALAKREADARAAGGALDSPTRSGSDAPASLRLATDALLVVSLAGYVAYTVAPDTVALHGTTRLAWTAMLVAAALGRFRQRLRRSTPPLGPAEIVASDPWILGFGAAWLAACAWIVAASH